MDNERNDAGFPDRTKETPKTGEIPTRDHPEQYPTEQPSLFDMFESEQNVDPIPVEDLNLEVREEKDKEATKHASSSERKYHTGFED